MGSVFTLEVLPTMNATTARLSQIAKSPDASLLLQAAAKKHATDGGKIVPGDILKVTIPSLGASLTERGWVGHIMNAPSQAFLDKTPSEVQMAVCNAFNSGNFTVSVVHCYVPTAKPMSAFAPSKRSA